MTKMQKITKYLKLTKNFIDEEYKLLNLIWLSGIIFTLIKVCYMLEDIYYRIH